MAISNEAQLALARSRHRPCDGARRPRDHHREETGDAGGTLHARVNNYGNAALDVPRGSERDGRARRGGGRRSGGRWHRERRTRVESISCGACSTSTGSSSPSCTSAERSRSPNVPSSSASPPTSRWSRPGSTWRRARWDDALAMVDPLPGLRMRVVVALTVAGTVRVRRGEDGAEEALEEAMRLADQLDEVAAPRPGCGRARRGRPPAEGDAAAASAIARPRIRGSRPPGGRDAARRTRRRAAPRPATSTSRCPSSTQFPAAVQARGDWRRAAELWREAGAPYQEAAALAEEPRRGRSSRRAGDPRPHRRGPARTARPGGAARARSPQHPARSLDHDPPQPGRAHRAPGRGAPVDGGGALPRCRDRGSAGRLGAHGRQSRGRCPPRSWACNRGRMRCRPRRTPDS